MEKLDMNALRTNAREFADSVRTYKDDARDHAELLLQKEKITREEFEALFEA